MVEKCSTRSTKTRGAHRHPSTLRECALCLLAGLVAFVWFLCDPGKEDAEASRALQRNGLDWQGLRGGRQRRPAPQISAHRALRRDAAGRALAGQFRHGVGQPSVHGWCFARSRSSATCGPASGPWRTRRRAFSRRGRSCRGCPTATRATANMDSSTKRPQGSGAACAARGTAATPSRMASTPRPPSAAPPTAAATSSPSASCTACPRSCAKRSQPPPAIHKAACGSSATKHSG